MGPGGCSEGSGFYPKINKSQYEKKKKKSKASMAWEEGDRMRRECQPEAQPSRQPAPIAVIIKVPVHKVTGLIPPACGILHKAWCSYVSRVGAPLHSAGDTEATGGDVQAKPRTLDSCLI